MEWSGMMLVFSLLGTLLAVPVAVLVMSVRRLPEWRSTGRGFPVQGTA